jgi:hypothetical protein
MRKKYDIWADGTHGLDVKIQEMFLLWNVIIARYGFDKIGFHKIEQLGCAVRLTFGQRKEPPRRSDVASAKRSMRPVSTESIPGLRAF